jgi:hypothetical protein
MVIGENNILQTVYEKNFHRRQDARSYINEQLRLKVDSPYDKEAQDFIIAFTKEPTPVINTVAEQIEYGKRISKKVLPKVLRIYLNNYIHRANDFNINNHEDLNFERNRDIISIREQIYEPLIYKNIGIQGAGSSAPYAPISFFGYNFADYKVKEEAITQGWGIVDSTKLKPSYRDSVKEFGLRVNSMLFPINEQFKSDLASYKERLEDNQTKPAIDYTPEFFDLVKLLNTNSAINNVYCKSERTMPDGIIDNMDDLVVTCNPIIYFSYFDILKMPYNQFRDKVLEKVKEFKNSNPKVDKSKVDTRLARPNKIANRDGVLVDYVPNNIYIKKNGAWDRLNTAFFKFAVYVSSTYFAWYGFGTADSDVQRSVENSIFINQVKKLKELLKAYMDIETYSGSYLSSSSVTYPNPWFNAVDYTNRYAGIRISTGNEITNADIGEYIFNSLSRKISNLVSLTPTGITGKNFFPVFYCGNALNENQVKLMDDRNYSYNFTLLSKELYYYSGDSLDVANRNILPEIILPSESNNKLHVEYGFVEDSDYIAGIYSWKEPIKDIYLEPLDERIYEYKNGYTWFMREFNSRYSVEQHKYKTLLNAMFDIVKMSALNNLHYGVLKGSALQQLKTKLNITQDDEFKTFFILTKTKDKNGNTHNIPLSDFYNLILDDKYTEHKYKNKVSDKNALMFRGENWRNKLSYADYMTDLRKKVEALPDHVIDRESIELIVKYVFFSVLHNICTSESESTLPDKIIATDTLDEALDKYYRANLLENIYTWTGDMNLSYKYI